MHWDERKQQHLKAEVKIIFIYYRLYLIRLMCNQDVFSPDLQKVGCAISDTDKLLSINT